ncbi:MAG: transporter substrate-binding domain-containing protein [Halopseudomonas aestusnigri]
MVFFQTRTLIVKSVLTIIFTFGSLLTATLAHAGCNRSYSISYSSKYIPYQYSNPYNMPAGLDIDIYEAVMREMGCKYSLNLMPSKRAQVQLKKGALDMMAAASITEERQVYANFSIPYRNEKVVMFVRTENLDKYQSYNLKKAVDNELRITAGLGGWYGAEYGEQKERALEKGALSLNTSPAIRMNQLLDGRTDLVVADLYVGYHHVINAGRINAVTTLPHILNSDPVHFMLSKSSVSAAEVNLFNQALARVLISERYQDLLAKYRPRVNTPTN